MKYAFVNYVDRCKLKFIVPQVIIIILTETENMLLFQSHWFGH